MFSQSHCFMFVYRSKYNINNYNNYGDNDDDDDDDDDDAW